MKGFEENTPGSPASVHRVGAILAAVVVSAVVIFSLGVMVGRRVTGTVATVEKPPPALPTETLVPPSSRPADESPGAGKPAQDVPEEKLTFFDTLSSEKAAAPTLPRKPEAEVASTGAEPSGPPAVTSGGTGKPAAEKSLEAPPPQEPPKTAALSPPDQVRALLGSGRYYVQVSSTTNRQWADDLVRKLVKKGISTESVPVTIKGTRWYRIRVGSFPDRGAAQKAQGILKKSMSLDGMVVTVD